MTTLNVLCAGAARTLVAALESDFTSATGAAIAARFGPVGELREAFEAGAACDVLVASDAILANLASAGSIDSASLCSVGQVATGVAVRAGESAPEISTEADFAEAVSSARAIHLPDSERATAGIHLRAVLAQLGLFEACAPRLRQHPSGSAAMAALAASTDAQALGIAQVTEIVGTSGVQLVGDLPPPHQLVTGYTAGISSDCAVVELASPFIARLCVSDRNALRRAGFVVS